jgi:peptidoglycan/xylan/chitin deacetylase (PgdA/CDA1 family)
MRNQLSYRLINLVISSLVATIDALLAVWGRLIGRPRRRTCVVFAYHSVKPEQRARFARQLEMILTHARPVAADLSALPDEPAHYAAITFDDGVENLIENAVPELVKRRIPATIFVVTDMLGENPRWEYRGANSTLQERTMSLEQLRALPQGLILIGSHTATHPFLPLLDAEHLRYELGGSRTTLEKQLKRQVKLFSSPYGESTEKMLEACRDAGYDRVFTTVPFLAFAQPNEFVTGRVGAAPTDWPLEFRLKLSGAYRWVPYAYAWKRRLFSRTRNRSLQEIEREDKRKAETSSFHGGISMR